MVWCGVVCGVVPHPLSSQGESLCAGGCLCGVVWCVVWFPILFPLRVSHCVLGAAVWCGVSVCGVVPHPLSSQGESLCAGGSLSVWCGVVWFPIPFFSG